MRLRSDWIRGLQAGVFLALWAAVASATPSQVPDPTKCVLQSAFLDVEGSTGGQPDNCSDGRCGNFTVTIRDALNAPILGSTVVIDFSACSDIQISCDQLTAVTGQSYVSPKRVSGVTNASGQFTFKVQGAANASPTTGNTTTAGTNAGVACATVYADGVQLTPQLMVVAYDINGLGSPTGAVSGPDASLVGSEVHKVALGAQARQRDDYNHSGTINEDDYNISCNMVRQAGLGTGSQKTAPFCASLLVSGGGADALSSRPINPEQVEATLNIDARALGRPFYVDQVPCACYDASVIQTVTVTGSASTIHRFTPCFPSCVFEEVTFKVSATNVVTVDPALAPAVTGNGTGTLVVNSYLFPPADDDIDQSMGQFVIIADPKFWPIVATYPGYAVTSSGLHRFFSPVLYDPATTIGRSALLHEGDAGDLAGVPVGTLGHNISDADFGVVPPGFSGPPGTPELHTEVATLNMVDHQGSGAAVRAGTAAPDRPWSPGEIQPTTPGGGIFPAKSFFNIYAEFDLPAFGGNPGLTTLYNSSPLLVENDNLECIPPTVVYFHGQTPPVPIVFKADDTQLPKRWLAGERLGWLVLGGHGLNYDPALNLKATGNHTSGTTTGGLSDFLQIMSEQVEMADTATRAVDVMDVVVSAPLAAYVLPAYSDSFLVALDQAATAARAGDPCESIRVLGTHREGAKGAEGARSF